jgi:tRNA A-37 threonylcarbamoyl transferase component Bud32
MDTARHEPDPGLPQTIGRYRIVSLLGEGAMGVVFCAQDDVMERRVAIKVMTADLEEDADTRARFYREARTAGQLRHPNIITIFDMGEQDGRPYIVMELFDGETLADHLKHRAALDAEPAIDLMIQICAGLDAAHARGIFHRDVKPGNLLVRGDGALKIVDFGIARLASSNMTVRGLIVGTPDYMSPEQARGHDVDQRSDIFSAGAVFYLMLTGRKPFAASDVPGVLTKVERQDPLPIRESEASPALARLVMKALAKDPAHRYQTCAQMAAELERLKRELEAETRQLVEDGRKRLGVLESLLQQRRVLAETVDIAPPPPDLEAARQELARRHASLSEPYRRRGVTALIADIKSLHDPAAEAIQKWQRARAAIEEGSRAAIAGRLQESLVHFESAIRVEPAGRRAAAEADRCRRLIADQRAIDERADALLAEARAAAAAGEWPAVIEMCSAPAVLTSRTSNEVAALKRRAAEALDTDARERRLERERALIHADTLRRKGQFDDALRAIARARAADPSASDVRLAEDRVHASRFEQARQSDVGRKVAQAAEAARRESEARRIAALQQRTARAAALAAAAEDALAEGASDRALELATRVLGMEPSNVAARRIAGLARVQTRAIAEARARTIEAARLLDDARQEMAAGRFQHARTLASSAAGLDPTNDQAAVVLVRIEEEAARAAAVVERLRLARLRADAVAPILQLAHAAEARHDYVRAAWTAENALALDEDCEEALAIVQRANAELDAHPLLKDETVPAGASEDPDDTVRLMAPGGAWKRVTGALIRLFQQGA